MEVLTSTIRKIQLPVLVATIVLVESVLWINSMEGGIIKQPLFVLGALLTAALFISECISQRNLEFSYSAINILLALHIILYLCSAVWKFDPLYTWEALAFGISCCIIFFAGSSLFRTQKEITILFRSLELLTILLGVIAVIQYFFIDTLPVNFYIKAGGRVSSLLGHSLFYSSYLVLLFPLLLGWTLQRRHEGASIRGRHLLLAAMVFLLLATQARSSILGWFASIVVFIFLVPKSKISKQTMAFLGIALAAVFFYSIVLRPDVGRRIFTMFETSQSSTLARRMYFWNAGKDAFLASPVFGHGIGSFERTAFQYRSPDYWQVSSEDIVPHAHNELVEIAVEYGITGLALFAITFIFVLRRGIAAARNVNNQNRWILAGITSSIIGIAVDNLGNISLRQPPIAILVWVFMGLLWSQSLTTEVRKKIRLKVPLPTMVCVVPLVAWIIFAVGYGRIQARAIDSSVHVLHAMDHGEEPSQEAIQECQAAVAENPESLIARSYLTMEYVNAKQWTDGLQSAEELQQLSPYYPKSALMKACALLGLGRYRDALESIRKELSERTHPEAYYIQAMTYRALSDSSEERSALLNLLRKDIKAKILYEYRSSCLRLVAISRTDFEKKENILLFDSLEKLITAEHEFFKNLRVQESVHS